MEVPKSWGSPKKIIGQHPFCRWMFHERNHPAIGIPHVWNPPSAAHTSEDASLAAWKRLVSRCLRHKLTRAQGCSQWKRRFNPKKIDITGSKDEHQQTKNVDIKRNGFGSTWHECSPCWQQIAPLEPPRESGKQCDQEDHKFKSNKPLAAEIERQRQQTAEAPAWNQQRCLKGQKQWIVQTSWAPLRSASPNPGFALWMGNWYVLFVDASMHMYELNTPKHTKRNDWESKDRMTYCMSSFRRKHLMRQVPKAWPPSLRNIKAKKD